MKYKRMSINVDFLAGTDISEAVKDAASLAKKLKVSYVCFKFNGIDCSISEKALCADEEAVKKLYHEALYREQMNILII